MLSYHGRLTPSADVVRVTVLAPAAVALAFLLDGAVAEFPAKIHPVALFGRLVEPFDRDWRLPGLVGVGIAVVLPSLAGLLVWGLVAFVAAVAPVAAAIAAGLVLFATTSRRLLLTQARDVITASVDELERARQQLPALVGRDTAMLSPGHVRSAAVESAAENLADGLVAPLLGFVLFAPISLPAAAAVATWVKAVNTLDSMVGYPDRPHGATVARLDDLVMWVPARLTALLLAVTAGQPAALATAHEAAGRPVSPNSGWPMATLGAIIDSRLEKPGAYTLDGGTLLPSVQEAHAGLDVVDWASILAFVLAMGTTGVVTWF